MRKKKLEKSKVENPFFGLGLGESVNCELKSHSPLKTTPQSKSSDIEIWFKFSLVWFLFQYDISYMYYAFCNYNSL